jgi:hypothetical protein
VVACKNIVELIFISPICGQKCGYFVFFFGYKVASYKVVVAFNFGGNHMLLQVNRMVKTLKTE